MDEPRVKELLDRAGQEYNAGKYSEAIASWQEVLIQDPDNQKAREGIRMAQLLDVNWEAQGKEDEGQASGASGGPVDAELQEKIEIGISRVRELMAAGKVQEALEGCQLLMELAPNLDPVQQLKEEVSHAFEAQPFIKEHLERARKLLGQGKLPDAVEEAKKVLSLDKNNAEAHGILNSAGASGPPDAATRPPSAFEMESGGSPAPPSPFAQGDDLAQQFDLEESGPQQSVEPAGAGSAGAGEFDLDFGDPGAAGESAAPAASSDNPEVQALITKGRQFFDAGRYNEAIDAWSHIYAVDQTNSQAAALIDGARAKLDEIARQADECYYRAVDLFEAGDLAAAEKEFRQVLSLQPDNADAKSYIEQIESKQSGGELGSVAAAAPAERPSAEEEFDLSDPASPDPDLVAAAASAPGAGGGGIAGDDIGPAPALAAPAPDPAPARSPAPLPAQKPLPVSAGPVRKPKPAPPPPGGGNKMVMIAVVAVVVVGGGAAGWYFLMGGSGGGDGGGETPAVATAGPAPGNAQPAGQPAQGTKSGTAAPGGTGEAAENPDPAPGENPAPPAPAPEALSPKEIERKVASLMREGKALHGRKSYAEAQAKFAEILSLDPGNFEAEELRMEAAQGVAEEARFNRELQAAKDAFSDKDWGASLYKFYRLREQRREMTILKRYIKNANYNWGIEAMDYFDLDAAIEHFTDALEMAPRDSEIKRAREVAERYKRRRRDPAFDSFVETLSPKELEDR